MSSQTPVTVLTGYLGSGKTGPMGKAPRELGTRDDALVVEVACHPSQDVVAAAYSDRRVMALNIENGAEALRRDPGRGAISTLTWDKAGRRLAFGSKEGECGVISISG